MAAEKGSAASEKQRTLEETKRRFKEQYLADKSDRYDSRDVERLQKDDSWLESFLLWRHNVVDDALKMIDDSFQWRKEFAVNDLNESVIPKWCFETGAIFLHGYDKEGNKLFWFKVKLHLRDGKTHLEKKKCVAFWLERYAKREPGKSVTVVFDMAETGLSNVDMDFVRFIINCFKIYYPKYLSKMVIFEMPWILNTAFKVVKSWLGPEAINMLKFVNKSEVQEYISTEYLPPHMGGSDPFRYSYPPLPDDDFQTPMSENGPIACEDEVEPKDEVESEISDSVDHNQVDQQLSKTKKVNSTEEFTKQDECDKVDSKTRHSKKTLTIFKGSLLHISPAEELHFGSKESGERKCSIILTNVTKNPVAFKVRTTAPEKYRVKPSNSSCEPGTSLDIVVSLHGGFSASPQDRFLVMAVEIDQSSGTGSQELAQFWKEVPRNLVMEHRLQCHVVGSSKPASLLLKESVSSPAKINEDLYFKLTQLLEVNRRLEDRLNHSIWLQKFIFALVALLVGVQFFHYVFEDNATH